MTFETFKTEITSQLASRLPSDVTITERRVAKNNNLILDGLVISKKNDFLSPTIYLNEYYDACDKKNVPFEDLVADIIAQYHNALPSKQEELKYLSDFERVKDKIIFRLVNFEKNEPLLKDCPHLPCLDLAVTFLCLLSIHSENDAVISIKNEHLSLWGVSEDVLLSHARANTPRLLPYTLQNITDLIPLAPIDAEPVMPQAKDLSYPMYVLTNRSKVHGAGCLLYSDVPEFCAKKIGGDYYILPSSIHEVLLVPAFVKPDPECLNSMIREVNRDMLSADEFLSDHAYYYSEKERSISEVA